VSAKVQIGTRRSVGEWFGATPDTPVPDYVKLRVFERENGVCHVSGRKIRGGEPWDAEHVKPLWDGGENRETNLKPALRDKHREKTSAEAAERADGKRVKAKHHGLGKSKQRFPKPQNPWGYRR
jgi:5-methylcytosine-specific restriction enzyme A